MIFYLNVFFLLGTLANAATLIRNPTWVPPKPTYYSPLCSVIIPHPEQYTCGTTGFLKDSLNFRNENTFAGSQIVSDFQTCRNWCLHRKSPHGQHVSPACKGFSYNHESRKCSFYVRLPEEELISSQNSNTSFWEPGCFDCTTTCPQPEVNLIDDGGFEHDPEYRGPWSNPNGMYVSGQVVSPGLNSRHAWKCTGQFCGLLQYRTLCPSHIYRLDLDFKIPPSAYTSSFYVTIGDEQYSQSVPSSGTGGWRHLAFTFRALYQLEVLTINFMPGCYNCNQSFYIDNVKLLPHSKNTVNEEGTKLAVETTNGGFESGVLAPWRFVRSGGKGSHSIVSPGLSPDSNYAFKYVSDTSTDGGFDNFRLQHPIPPLELYHKYWLRFHYKVTGIINFNMFVGGMQWQLLHPLGVMNHVNESVVPVQNKTVLFERMFTCSDTDSVLAINVEWDAAHNGSAGSEVVYLDNFVIDEAF